jgi:hypothetical protein
MRGRHEMSLGYSYVLMLLRRSSLDQPVSLVVAVCRRYRFDCEKYCPVKEDQFGIQDCRCP